MPLCEEGYIGTFDYLSNDPKRESAGFKLSGKAIVPVSLREMLGGGMAPKLA